MHYIVAGGTGFIGQYLIREWIKQDYHITVIGRDPQKIKHIFNNQVDAYCWEEFAKDYNHLLVHSHLLLNLAGANIGEKRWSEARKKEIYDSRIFTTQKLSSLCASLGDKSPPFFCASAVGIYGLQTEVPGTLPPPMDEDSALEASKSCDFLSKIARDWEEATFFAKAHGVRTVNLRFSVVLGNGGVLQMLRLPYLLGLGGTIGSGCQPFPWIHIVDLYRAIEFLLHHGEMTGAFNLVSPCGITQREFAKTLAKILHRPCWLRMPAFVLKLLFGEMAEELLLQGQHAVPKRLLESGFTFQFPELENALLDIFKK